MGRWSRRLALPFVAFTGIADGTGEAQHVLDVGCGTGSLAFCLAGQRRIARVTGLDLSPAYVAHAERHNEHDRVRFAVGDACAMPFPERLSDHALSLLVLQFVPEARRAVREMCRVTRKGGIVAAATWDSAGGLLAQRLVFDAAALIHPGGNAARAVACTRPLSRPGELADLWQAAGLVDVVQDMLTIRMDFACFRDFWAPVEGRDGPVAPYVRGLGPRVRMRLRSAVEQAYLAGAADGPRSYAATAWVVKGRVI